MIANPSPHDLKSIKQMLDQSDSPISDDDDISSDLDKASDSEYVTSVMSPDEGFKTDDYKTDDNTAMLKEIIKKNENK
jgi:hypothetical protein